MRYEYLRYEMLCNYAKYESIINVSVVVSSSMDEQAGLTDSYFRGKRPLPREEPPLLMLIDR